MRNRPAAVVAAVGGQGSGRVRVPLRLPVSDGGGGRMQGGHPFRYSRNGR